MRWLISHTSIGEEGPDLFWPFFSYASDADLRRNRKESLVPENGDTGVVEPAGEARGDPLSYPGGFTIMMLRVTLVVCSDDSSPYDLTLPASISLPELDRAAKVFCFRSLPRPFSGRGPATVSSHNWSRRPMNGSGVF